MSTPISQLPINQSGQSGSNVNMSIQPNTGGSPQQMPQMQPIMQPPMNQDNQLVDDILREMEDPSCQDSNIDAESLNYTMDSSQIPPEQMPMNNLPQVSKEGGYLGGLNMSQYVDQNALNFKQRILNYLKQPIIVFVICVVLTIPQFNRLLARFIPRLLHESGHFNMYGILFKGLLGALAFFVANYFVN